MIFYLQSVVPCTGTGQSLGFSSTLLACFMRWKINSITVEGPNSIGQSRGQMDSYWLRMKPAENQHHRNDQIPFMETSANQFLMNVKDIQPFVKMQFHYGQ